MDKSIERLDHRLEKLEERVDAIYQSRDRVKIQFGIAWTMASFLIALAAAGMTRLFA